MRASARVWFVLGILALVVAIIFPILTRNIIQVAAGSTMLGVFALSMLYISWVLRQGADTDFADRIEEQAHVGPEHLFPASWWPPMLAAGVAILGLGIRFTPIMVAFGGAFIAVSALGWFDQYVGAGTHGADHDDHGHQAGAEAATAAEARVPVQAVGGDGESTRFVVAPIPEGHLDDLGPGTSEQIGHAP